MLILGASIAIIFTYFFIIDSHFIHLVMTGMTPLVSMSLYLMLLFGDPFSGDMRVSNGSLLLAEMILPGTHQGGERPRGSYPGIFPRSASRPSGKISSSDSAISARLHQRQPRRCVCSSGVHPCGAGSNMGARIR